MKTRLSYSEAEAEEPTNRNAKNKHKRNRYSASDFRLWFDFHLDRIALALNIYSKYGVMKTRAVPLVEKKTGSSIMIN